MNVRGFDYRCVAIAAAVVFGAAVIPAQAGPRAVIELFTSQGCSSCPPADRLLGDLAQDPSLLALSLSVDYWDYIGWKDTLALRGHSARQRAYAHARGERQIYTPQAVINGVADALGSDKSAIEQAIVNSRRSARPLSLPVSVSIADGEVTVQVAASTGAPGSGEVWLSPVTSKAPVKIGRGENRGLTIAYHNVVRGWVKLGDWNGEPQTFRMKVSRLADDGLSIDEVDRIAVLVQSGSAATPGLMLGAAMAELPAAAR